MGCPSGSNVEPKNETARSAQTCPLAGDRMDTTGASLITLTITESLPTAPKGSVALTVITWVPRLKMGGWQNVRCKPEHRTPSRLEIHWMVTPSSAPPCSGSTTSSQRSGRFQEMVEALEGDRKSVG